EKDELYEKYSLSSIHKNCVEMTEDDVSCLIKKVLYEFPVEELGIHLPAWVETLPADHPIKSEIYSSLREEAEQVVRVRDIYSFTENMSRLEEVSSAEVGLAELGSGYCEISIELPRELFYETLSSQSGFRIADDGDLLSLLCELASVKSEYDRVASALRDVRETGYGIVLPGRDEMVLQEPEIVKRGGHYGVRMKASASSIHMLKADVETEVSPAVGGERSSEEIINFILQEFEGDSARIWESNIFGKSLFDIAGEGLNAKIKRMPDEAREKLREALERIINEGSNGLICIIL
ncbi:MAG: stage IV sporulation protein A, partial [Oscillospiraceae bacterium]|nr:stage IV sporulation protein A [Oscillospiraceae bacterium]